jgi:hypothetical protein
MNVKMAIFLTIWHQNSSPIAIIKTHDLNYKRFDFSCKMSPKKFFLKEKEKSQHGHTRKPIIGQRTCCVIRELNPAPCNAAYVLFSTKGLT